MNPEIFEPLIENPMKLLTDNVLTYGSAGLAFGAGLLAQAAAPAVEAIGGAVAASTPGVEALGLTGAVIGLAVLSVRVGGECFRAWVAYQEASLHAGELRGRIAELEAEEAKQRKLAARGICPLSEDGSAACGRGEVGTCAPPAPPPVPPAE